MIYAFILLLPMFHWIKSNKTIIIFKKSMRNYVNVILNIEIEQIVREDIKREFKHVIEINIRK